MKIDGACHCGLIKYEAEIDPEKVRVCHAQTAKVSQVQHFGSSFPFLRTNSRCRAIRLSM